MQKLKYALTFALCLFLATAALTFAWPEGAPQKVLISGPGIKGEVEVSERTLLEGLGPEQFIDFNQRISPAPKVGEGFKLTRYTQYDPKSSDLFVDHLRYFPHASGGRGYVLYEGSDSGGGSGFKGQWFYATRPGDDAMHGLIKKLGGSLTASQPSAAESITVKLDGIPAPLVANQPLKIGLTVLKPGAQPFVTDALIVYAGQAENSSATVIVAKADDAPGHYVGTFDFPRAGKWYLTVDLGPLEGRQELSPLTVVAPQPANNTNTGGTTNNPATPEKEGQLFDPLTLAVSLMGLAVFIGAGGVFVFWLRRRSRKET